MTRFLRWRESDGAHYQIWTGLMNRDETESPAFKRTATPFDKHNPQLEVQGMEIYLTWHEADRPDWRKARYYQIWTASMKMDGTGGKRFEEPTHLSINTHLNCRWQAVKFIMSGRSRMVNIVKFGPQ